jgi:excisionase family DNA binding protein
MRDRGQLLTAAEVAAMLRVRQSWVYAEARAGRIPHVRLGRYTRFLASSVEAWIFERETGPAPKRPVSG